MTFVAYFDDTGRHQSPESIGFGGLIGRASDWDSLAKEWAKCCERNGLSKFHRFDAKNRTGEFRGKSYATGLGVTGEFLALIEKLPLKGLGCLIEASAWKAVMAPIAAMFENLPQTPLQMAAEACVAKSCSWMEKHYPSDRLTVVFDDLLDGQVDSSVQRFRRLLHRFPMLSGVTYAVSKDTLPLQAADIVAYEAQSRFASRRDEGERVYPRLMRAIDVDGDFYDSRELVRLLRDWGKAGALG